MRALHQRAATMKRGNRTLLLVGAIVVLLLVGFGQLAGMSLRFFGTSTLAARALGHYLAGDYGGAARLYRDDLARSAARTPAESPSSWLLMARGDLEEAASRAHAESRLAPSDPEPLLTLAEIALARRHSPAAVELAGRVLRLRRDDYDALLVTAVAQARLGIFPAAIEALKRALRYEQAERRRTTFLAVLEITGELDDQAIDARPSCLLAHLHRYLHIHDPSQADPTIRYALRAIDAGDRADDGYVTLAAIDARQGRPTRGFTRLQEALVVNPRNTAALLAAARYRGRRDDLAEEYRLTRAAFEADPADPFVFASLQSLLVDRLGDYREALALAEAAVAFDARNAEAWWRRGRVQMHLGDLRQALHSYQQAALLGPRTAELEDSIGRVLSRLGRDAEAAAAYQRAVALDPLRAGPHDGLGLLHDRARRRTDAIREYEMALMLGSPSVGLCELYWETGRRSDVAACVKRVLALDPDNPQGLALLDHLRGAPQHSARTAR